MNIPHQNIPPMLRMITLLTLGSKSIIVTQEQLTKESINPPNNGELMAALCKVVAKGAQDDDGLGALIGTWMMMTEFLVPYAGSEQLSVAIHLMETFLEKGGVASVTPEMFSSVVH